LDPENEWLKNIQDTYNREKKNIYFKIPILPKKLKLDDPSKIDQLKLNDLEGNIMHEMARRKRWNYIHRGAITPAGAEMFF
jgi:hypothetical protein